MKKSPSDEKFPLRWATFWRIARTRGRRLVTNAEESDIFWRNVRAGVDRWETSQDFFNLLLLLCPFAKWRKKKVCRRKRKIKLELRVKNIEKACLKSGVMCLCCSNNTKSRREVVHVLIQVYCFRAAALMELSCKKSAGSRDLCNVSARLMLLNVKFSVKYLFILARSP